MGVNSLCSVESGGSTRFPCDINAATAVSVGLGAGGVALFFVFFLLYQVSTRFW